MQKKLNLKVEYLKSFSPSAPSVLRKGVLEWFEADYESQYMLLVNDVKNYKRIEINKEKKSLFLYVFEFFKREKKNDLLIVWTFF